MRYAFMSTAGVAAIALLAGCDRITGSGGGGAFGPPVGMAACTSAPILNTSPAALANITAIIPLGNLNPGGHTFPSDHIYFVIPRDGATGDPISVPVVSPGEIHITGVASSSNNSTTRTDYSLYFFGCSDVQFYFHHIQTLAPALADAIGPITGDCSTYSTGGDSYTRCNKSVDVALHPGDAIGNGGGPGIYAFDLGAYDRRTAKLAFVDQSRPDFGSYAWNTFHTVCPLDYFASPTKEQLEALLGNDMQARTIPPICGTIMQDVANTAQGRWFNGPSQQEDPHLALVHDNVDPTIGAISMGTSVPSIPLGVYSFNPSTDVAARVNVDFNLVTADGTIYCYGDYVGFGTPERPHILLQLVTNTSLKIEGIIGSSCPDPAGWTFTSSAVTFAR